jgi:hypothetical protein
MKDLSSPDILVERDQQGNVRLTCHPFDPEVQGDGAVPLQACDETSLRSMADNYRKEFSGAFGLEKAGAGFTASLRPGNFKQVTGDMATVSFDQYVDDWPVWRAGVTVRIDAGRMCVTGAHNAAHLDIRLHRCGEDAPYAAARMNADVLQRLLGLPPGTPVELGACRMLVYGFTLANRLAGPEGAPSSPSFPGIALPELPQAAKDLEGMHCVVTEALFALKVEHWGAVRYRAFIEPDSGVVLYLRALTSGATTLVFPRNPASPQGQPLTAASQPVELDGARQQQPLLGLDPPDAGGMCSLAGEFIRLADLDVPPTAMPVQGDPFAFAYACETLDFAACSAYYHCDAVFRMIESLGFARARYFPHTNFPVAVDPHAFDLNVNAQALGNADGWGLAQFMFGSTSEEGKLGIAADVRVVLHEFGHALLWEHIGSPNFPFAHSPGDSLAAIVQAPFSQDGGRTFPFLAHLPDFDRRHDRRVEDGWGWAGGHWDSGYGGEQVLSSSLFRLYRATGGDTARQEDKEAAARYVVYLLLKAIAMLQIAPDKPEVLVDALIEADASTASFAGFARGSLGKVIRWAFEQQGLYQAAGDDAVSLTAGAPPPVDVYIDDGPGRKGGYLPYLDDFLSPPGLWNRVQKDGVQAHEAPNVGVPNFAYVQVSNRGTTVASQVDVFAFQMQDGAQGRWRDDWVNVAGGPLRVPAPIPAGGKAVVGPIEWTPHAAQDHLLVYVDAPGDRSSLAEANPVGLAVDCYMRLDNNCVTRRF